MRSIRVVMYLLAMISSSARAGADDAEDRALLSGVLALVQPIVHLAAHSPDPQAARKAIDAMLAGRNDEANRIAAGVFDGMLSDVAPEHRPALRAIGRDLLALARREQGRAAALPPPESTERAIQARKALHAMGLRYWDEQQYQDAVQRGDTIAIELYLAARGLRNPPAAR
jgi:hypothetical protein